MAFNGKHTEETKKKISETLKGHNGNSGCFKKGNIPFNKGKKMRTTTYSKCEPTMFKKGHKPHNYAEIGTERITKDGYIEVKIQDGKKNKNWKQKHRIVYENYYNKEIPKENSLIFLDQNKQNFNIDNLMEVPKSLMTLINSQIKLCNNKDINTVKITLAKLIAEKQKKEKKYGNS